MEISQFIAQTTQKVMQRIKVVEVELAKMPPGILAEERHRDKVYSVLLRKRKAYHKRY